MDLHKKESTPFFLLSLGCPKNEIDAEVMAGLLREAGYRPVERPEDARLILINTCAFILPAREESIEAILTLAQYKQKGTCRHLVVTGCLPQRYGPELARDLPEVDLFLGIDEIPRIARHIEKLVARTSPDRLAASRRPSFLMDAALPRMVSGPRHTAYLKIADGCSNCCAYCAIPQIRGPYRSRRLDDVLREAEHLVQNGTREIILTAQDTTAWGKDRKSGERLPRLLRELSRISDLHWLRLLYTYPAGLTDGILEAVAEEEKICEYLDIPIQHIDDGILAAMNRRGGSAEIRKVIRQAREIIPGVALRTSLIVGFPGETIRRFNALVDFVRETRFDHLGVFVYSKEEGTPAAEMPQRISKKEKERRWQVLMEEQAEISAEINASLVGTMQEVLVEGPGENPDYPLVGRCRRQAPEIDGVTCLKKKGMKTGQFRTFRITGSDVYDLFA
ncbi:MAG TPA: 30S ribosomal protein S12 methylthiotransferase RimO [Syntrophales bacterium]|nr:30S ribosomal protein S12 methylthiotransferase RimO [Syntrophales bacterium]